VAPVGGEDVVGLAAQEEGVHAANAGHHPFADQVVVDGSLPTAVREAVLRVFVAASRRLHDAVERAEEIDVDAAAHGFLLHPSVAVAAPAPHASR
jgi:hypothetical protein